MARIDIVKTRALLAKKHMAGLRGVAIELSNQAKVRSGRHVFSGNFRNSITHTENRRQILWGVSIRSVPYAPHLEFGFKPHWTNSQSAKLWAQRNIKGRGAAKRKAAIKGLYVGGPNSMLDTGLGGASGRRGCGPFQRWQTKGQRSPLLKPGSVGFSVLRWTVKNRLRSFSRDAYLRGFENGE